ncbi:MAG: DinB family protein [Anaerolineales bacterium]|nr:MAG: DinB family protein [Anaerolineales bacterium]
MSRKEEILTDLLNARQQILSTAARVPAEKQDEIFLGVWSLKDLLAHLIGWDYSNVEAVKDILSGSSPAVFQHWNPDWSAYNARLVKEYKLDDFTEMMECIQGSHQGLIDTLHTIPAEEFEKDFGIRSPSGAKITVAWYLQFEIDDEEQHYQQVENWLAETNA